MAKRLHGRSSSTPSGKHHFGCMGGLLHFFDSHQHFHIRRMILDRRHGEGRHGTGTKHTRHKTIALPTGNGHECMDGGANFPMEDQNNSEKISGKANIGELVDEEMSKEPTQRQRRSPSKMMRTVSMHHLKCNDGILPEGMTADSNTADDTFTFHPHGIDTSVSGEDTPRYPKSSGGSQCDNCGEAHGTFIEMSNEGNNQLDSLNSVLVSEQALLQEKLNEAKAYAKDLKDDFAVNRAKSFLDALELFNMNREIFLKIIQDPNSLSQKYLQDLQNSSVDPVLTKSGSCQGPGSSGRGVRSSKQKHRRMETEPFSKQEIESQYELLFSNTGTEVDLGHSSDISLSDTYEPKKQMDDGISLNRFKDIKQRIKNIIKKSKNAGIRISMDGILHKVPYGHKTSKYLMGEGSLSNKYSPTSSSGDWSVTNGTKYGSPHFTKSRSLTESVDRYTCLIESNLGQESKKNATDRMKLVQENSALQAKNPQRTQARIRSLPDFDAYFSGRDTQCESPDIISLTRTPSQVNSFSRAPFIDFGELNSDVDFGVSYELKTVDTRANAEEGTESIDVVEKESQQYTTENNACSANEVPDQCVPATESENTEEDDVLNDVADKRIIDDAVHDPEAGYNLDNSFKQAEPSTDSVSNSFFQEDLICPPTISVSEVSEMEIRSNCSEASSLAHPVYQTTPDTPYLDKAISEIFSNESGSNRPKSDALPVLVSSKDEAEFNYVWDILNKSGLVGSEFLGRWYSPDLPLDPSLFEELEGSNCEPDMSSYDIDINLDHLLLFDLINEVLLEMYDACCAVQPWLSCFDSQLTPIRMGSHVLEEVWSTISWHLSCQPLLNPTMEYVVNRDFAKNDRWMHVNYETDDICMELEEMIFDDLLDQAILDFLNRSDHQGDLPFFYHICFY